MPNLVPLYTSRNVLPVMIISEYAMDGIAWPATWGLVLSFPPILMYGAMDT